MKQLFRHIRDYISRHDDLFVLFVLCVSSILSLFFYFSHGLHFAYNDATSHLNISRRVVDSVTPGIVQVGSTWLPLLHILEIAFIWHFYLWQSGLAGSFISMLAFIAGGISLYKGIKLLFAQKNTALFAAILYISNANLLYMQTTAMFEPLLIGTLLASFYLFIKWTKTDSPIILALLGFTVMLCTLTRYDGWFVFAGISALLVFYSLKPFKLRLLEGRLILFCTMGSSGIIAWLIYNLTIFGSPLYFAFNEFSAHAQQAEFYNKGLLATKNNVWWSLASFSQAALLNSGLILFFIGLIGLVIFFVKYRLRKEYLAAYILMIPLIFNIFAMYKGHALIWLPNIPPHFNTFFNVRYGILLVPAVIFFTAFLYHSYGKLLKFTLCFAVITQIAFYYSIFPHRSNSLSFVTLRDTVASINHPTKEATDWLRANYNGGMILISSASSESFIFHAGIEMKNYITEGTGKYWKTALINPSDKANYVVFFKSFSDRVGKKMKENTILKNRYSIAYENELYYIYKAKDNIFTLESGRGRAGPKINNTIYDNSNVVYPEDYIAVNYVIDKLSEFNNRVLRSKPIRLTYSY